MIVVIIPKRFRSESLFHVLDEMTIDNRDYVIDSVITNKKVKYLLIVKTVDVAFDDNDEEYDNTHYNVYGLEKFKDIKQKVLSVFRRDTKSLLYLYGNKKRYTCNFKIKATIS